MRRYSNRSELLKQVQVVLRRIEARDQVDEPGVRSTERRDGGGRRPVRERLSASQTRELVGQFRSGVSKDKLVEQYGVSRSSVKRILRAERIVKLKVFQEAKVPRAKTRKPSG